MSWKLKDSNFLDCIKLNWILTRCLGQPRKSVASSRTDRANFKIPVPDSSANFDAIVSVRQVFHENASHLNCDLPFWCKS